MSGGPGDAPVRQIALPDWAARPAVRHLLDVLSEGRQGPRFVGGCVRDSLVGRRVKDVDLATLLPPEAVLKRLKAAGIGAVPTGLAHGTVTALLNHKPYEITTLRRDEETFGRHARVAFTEDWREDAARRDLTMNALSLDPDGRLYDYFGGLDDLDAGKVRFIGAAAQRIAEDYLRILRFFRFHASYGGGPLDPEGLAAAARLAGGLEQISAERKRDEFLKTLAVPTPLRVLSAMAEHGIAAHILPPPLDLTRLAALLRLAPQSDALLRLAALLGESARDAGRVAELLRLSKRQEARLGRLLKAIDGDEALVTPLARRRRLFHQGAEALRDAAALQAAAGRIGVATLTSARAEAGAWRQRPLPIGGTELLDLGIAGGPAMGAVFRRLQEAWIVSDFSLPKADLLRLAVAE